MTAPWPTVLVAVPGAVAALVSLWSLVPLSRRRRHVHRVKRFAEIVNVTGEDCPKVLRDSMIREAYRVASYEAVRYTGYEKFLIFLQLFSAVAIPLGLYGVALLLSRVSEWVGAIVVLVSLVLPAMLLQPTMQMYRWLRIRRDLYAKLGGRADIPTIPCPSSIPFRRQAPTAETVEAWLNKAFRGPVPSFKTIKAVDMRLLGEQIDNWAEKNRVEWLERIIGPVEKLLDEMFPESSS
ncbi:hypothetical protein [Nocardia nepalensis]|uniref:hypothetical protein n=1 Tax=Nocardia nepalensis TaxID=3375448 RepID=UPI003B677424